MFEKYNSTVANKIKQKFKTADIIIYISIATTAILQQKTTIGLTTVLPTNRQFITFVG